MAYCLHNLSIRRTAYKSIYVHANLSIGKISPGTLHTQSSVPFLLYHEHIFFFGPLLEGKGENFIACTMSILHVLRTHNHRPPSPLRCIPPHAPHHSLARTHAHTQKPKTLLRATRVRSRFSFFLPRRINAYINPKP